MKISSTLLVFALLLAGNTAKAADLRLWRLDCGAWVDRPITDSCYLIRHDKSWILWDTGLGAELAGRTAQHNTAVITLRETLVSQLARLNVAPGQVGIVGLSHLHFDHIGQAASFADAILMMGRKDYDAIAADPALAPRLTPWIENGGKKDLVEGDRDIFGDGSVVMLSTPGHTAGHYSLLVRLKHTGPVLLTGDLYHSTEQRMLQAVGPHDFDPDAMRGSFGRFEAIAGLLHAKVIIPHEPGDIATLPPFPASAD